MNSKNILVLFLCLFSLALYSQELPSIDSLCDQALIQIDSIENDNQNLKQITESLKRDLELDKITITDSRKALAISESKISDLSQIVLTLKIDLDKDKDTLTRQDKLLKEQEQAYKNLEKLYFSSKRLNKYLSIGLAITVPVVVIETIIIVKKLN